MPDGSIQIVAQARSVALFSVASAPRHTDLFPPPPPDPNAPPRHPWLAVFEQAPQTGFNDLLTGHAGIGPLDRLEVPEAANELFGRLPAGDPARLSLGWAILDWLEARRQEAPPADAPNRRRWIREVRDALDIVALLQVGAPAVALRRGFVIWNAWTGGLIAAPSRDARAAYWSMLAQTQPLVHGAEPGLEPFGLATHWLWICENAGSVLPESYLGIGLLGLRRLPETAHGSELSWLTGLACWAQAQHPSQDAFLMQWRALKFLYPRAPTRWRDLVALVLAAPRFRHQGIIAPAWWGADPDLQ